MPLSKFSFIIATTAFILVTGVISYASSRNPVDPSLIANVVTNPIPTDNSVSTSTISTRPTIPKTNTPIPTSPSQAATPTVDNHCIIVVDGQRYDVTVFRNQHSGGDIFSCGTDMSSIFHQQHNQRYLQMMAPYRI